MAAAATPATALTTRSREPAIAPTGGAACAAGARTTNHRQGTTATASAIAADVVEKCASRQAP